jgi:two-component system LytT family response regulator
MNRQIRAVLVDDEWLARHELRALLAAHPEIIIVAEAENIAQAQRLIAESRPEVVFLDVQLAGESGFELLNEVDTAFKVIFVTAYDKYALRAFEVNALDYLLKPIPPDRLAKAIQRLSAPPCGAKRLEKFDYTDYLFLTTDKPPRFIKINTVVCIGAAGDYSEIFTADGKKTLLLRPLKEWEARLPEKYFLRISRSVIVNLEYVERIERGLNYSYQVYCRNLPAPFTISRRYAARLKSRAK